MPRTSQVLAVGLLGAAIGVPVGWLVSADASSRTAHAANSSDAQREGMAEPISLARQGNVSPTDTAGEGVAQLRMIAEQVDQQPATAASPGSLPQYAQKLELAEALIEKMKHKEDAANREVHRLKTNIVERSCNVLVTLWMVDQKHGRPVDLLWSPAAIEKTYLRDVEDWTISRVNAEPDTDFGTVELTVLRNDQPAGDWTITVDLRDARDPRIWTVEPRTATPPNLPSHHKRQLDSMEALAEKMKGIEDSADREVRRRKAELAKYECEFILGKWMRAQRRGEPPTEQFWSSDAAAKVYLHDVKDWAIGEVTTGADASFATVELTVFWEDQQASKWVVTVDLRDARDPKIWAVKPR